MILLENIKLKIMLAITGYKIQSFMEDKLRPDEPQAAK
jgi:hypothetical protein